MKLPKKSLGKSHTKLRPFPGKSKCMERRREVYSGKSFQFILVVVIVISRMLKDVMGRRSKDRQRVKHRSTCAHTEPWKEERKKERDR